ncbi:hypothetical protein HDV57DRAFT_133631 [Trichoderma longibrachiatum]|uniref:Uncharacterized protein n=1 Tax=Trichoderma longibrachiatum ATCC 18648 TaxID=983965 RepID=A0A2T4BRV8_TRILO|nr:hypothetical protein M440DRAFT_1097720 [Trichoderma longibrachiatum ATCC 18648]
MGISGRAIPAVSCRGKPQTMLHTVRALLSNAPFATETTHHQPHSPPEFSRCRHHDVFALRPSHRYDTADSSFAATSSRLSSGAASSGRLNVEPCLRDRRAEVGRQGRTLDRLQPPTLHNSGTQGPSSGLFWERTPPCASRGPAAGIKPRAHGPSQPVCVAMHVD